MNKLVMNKLVMVPVALLSTSVFAFKPFVSAQFGQGMSNNTNISGAEAIYHALPGSVTTINYAFNEANNRNSAKVGFGAMFNQYVGFELSYLKTLSPMKKNIEPVTDDADHRMWTVSEESRFSALRASVVLDIPITQDGRFYLHQQTGVAYNNIEHKLHGESSVDLDSTVYDTDCNASDATIPSWCTEEYNKNESLSSSGFGFDVGVGFGYHVTNHFSLEVGYDNSGTLKGRRNIQMYSAGIKYLI